MSAVPCEPDCRCNDCLDCELDLSPLCDGDWEAILASVEAEVDAERVILDSMEYDCPRGWDYV